MLKRLVTAAVLVLASATAHAADKVTVSAAEVEAVVSEMFKKAPDDWKGRVTMDETQRLCTETRNNPKPADGEKLVARELATIAFPADGNVMGDWKKGEKLHRPGPEANSPMVLKSSMAATATPAIRWPNRN